MLSLETWHKRPIATLLQVSIEGKEVSSEPLFLQGSPSSLSHSLYDSLSRPFTTSGHTPANQCFCEAPITEHSTQGADSPVLSTWGQNCPSPADHAILDTGQEAAHHVGTLLAHILPDINQHPKFLSDEQPSSHSSLSLERGIVVTQIQDPMQKTIVLFYYQPLFLLEFLLIKYCLCMKLLGLSIRLFQLLPFLKVCSMSGFTPK